MRVFVLWAMAFAMMASPVMARSEGGGDKKPEVAETATTSATSAEASDAPATSSKVDSPAKSEESIMESELQELRDLMDTQSKQIQAQSEQLKQEQQKMQMLEEELEKSRVLPENLAVASASAAPSPAVQPAAAVTAPATSNTGKAPANQDPDQTAALLHFKGITLSPGGYFAAETVSRNRAIGSDINSAFNSVPLPGNEQSHISENNFSGRQSRISMLAQGQLSSVTIGGYYEGDFLSAGTTSNDNQSNSYTWRQRQFFAQAKFNSGWTVTGGQMWSLITETKKGVDNRTEATTQTIDAQYNVGFSWARQYGFRVAKDFGDKVWLAASVEEAQTTLTASGQNNNFVAGSYGITSGLYNPVTNYAFNAAPDFIAKAAFEPGWGHYEIFGILTTFRDRIYPCATAATAASCSGVTGPSAAGGYNDTRNGGGFGANARARVLKHIDVGVHFLGGSGIGRYGSVGLPDTTVRPNGTLAAIRNFQSLGTIEYFGNKLDIYSNVGDEYSARAAYTIGSAGEGYGSPLFNNSGCWTETLPGSATSTATSVGGSAGFVPGSLSNCAGNTRTEIEGTLGFWYHFYRGPMGTLQFGVQESYFIRDTWSGIGTKTGVGSSGQPHGSDNMIFTSFRYYIP